jgi:hypothetical protein
VNNFIRETYALKLKAAIQRASFHESRTSAFGQ